jgi:transposase-like protein
MGRPRAPRHKRLTQNQRFAIVRKRAEGVPIEDLAREFGVSTRSIFYTLKADQSRKLDARVRSELVNVRLTPKELAGFDAVLTRHDITSRAEGLRRLIQASNDLFVPDDELANQMQGLSASLNRTGNNINQIAQRLNEAKRQGKTPPYGKSAHSQVRALAGLIFDIADQVQDMAQRRRSALSGEVARVLGGFADGPE